MGMDKDVRTIVNYKLSAEITKLRSETNASVEALALMGKEARAEMKKEMLYAIRSASQVAKADLNQAVLIANKKFVAFEKKASASHAKSALERKAFKAQAVAAGKSISRMLRDSVATVNRAHLAYADETAKAIKKSNMAVDAHARQMEANAKKVAAEIKAQTATVQKKIAEHVKQSAANLAGFTAKDKARAAAARKFLTTQLAKAEKASAAKFGTAYVKLAKDRRYASEKLGAAVAGLNDSLAKQAALADSRFAKTVKDLSTARSQAAAQVKQLRKDFATQLTSVTAFTKKVESRLVGEIAVATGEVISLKANQLRINRRVSADLKRIVRVSDKRFSQSKRARGKLKLLMDENKAAASAEVAALATSLKTKLAHARARNNCNRIEMAKDLTQATKAVYEKMANVQKAQMAASGALSAATSAAATATSNSLKRAKKMFATKIVCSPMLSLPMPSVPSATSLPSLASFTTSPRPTPPTVPSSGPRLRPWRLTSTRPLLVLSRLVRPRPRLSSSVLLPTSSLPSASSRSSFRTNAKVLPTMSSRSLAASARRSPITTFPSRPTLCLPSTR